MCSRCISARLGYQTGRQELGCGHCYHAECLDQWLMVNISCPVRPVKILRGLELLQSHLPGCGQLCKQEVSSRYTTNRRHRRGPRGASGAVASAAEEDDDEEDDQDRLCVEFRAGLTRAPEDEFEMVCLPEIRPNGTCAFISEAPRVVSLTRARCSPLKCTRTTTLTSSS